MEDSSELNLLDPAVDIHDQPQDKPSNTIPKTLSERERLVVEMVGSGKRVGEIAKELKISVKTVSTYRVRALNKLGLKTNGELVHYILTNSSVDHRVNESTSHDNSVAIQQNIDDSNEL